MTFKIAPRESLQKCQSYENKFRAYPEEARLRHARAEASRIDSQESEDRKVERLLMDRYLKGGLAPKNDVLLMALGVVKFVAAAFMLPPYLVFFTLPKWVFINLAQPAEEGAAFLTKSFARVSAWMHDVFGIMIQKTQKIVKKMKKTIHTITEASKDFAKRIADELKFRLNQIFQPVVKTAGFISHQAVKPFSQAANIVKKILNFRISLPSLKKPKMDLSFVRSVYSGIKTRIEEFRSKLKELARKTVERVMDPAREVLKKIKAPFTEAAKIISQTFESASAKIEPYINYALAIVPWVSQAYQNLNSYSLDRVKQAAETVKNITIALGDRARAFAVWSASQLRTFRLQSLNRINRFFDPSRKAVKKAAAFIASAFSRIIKEFSSKKKALKQSFQDMKEKTARALKTLKDVIRKTPAYLFELLKRALVWAGWAIKEGIKALKYSVVLIRVFVRITAHFIKEMSNDFIGMLSFAKQP